jgi:hypothetical protein
MEEKLAIQLLSKELCKNFMEHHPSVYCNKGKVLCGLIFVELVSI